ncbi:MAG: Ig-like domain repeat protein [Actinomycetota bacterium]|nr:Ig-like domain repeat protein [Actinomycetota bacterium]MDP2287194.1 Ig-like domain repeat protein [Actinomycetota bacterium]
MNALLDADRQPHNSSAANGTLRTRVVRAVAGAVAVATIATGAVTLAPAASAATTITFQPSGGTVGFGIPLKASVADGASDIPPGLLSYFLNSGTLIGSTSVSSKGVSDPVTWTPVAAGSAALYSVYRATDGSETVTSNAVTVSIAKAATTTVVEGPAMAKTSSVQDYTATVKTSGSYVPAGTVTFQTSDGTPIETKALSSQGKATISIQLPSTAQTFGLKASYTPDSNTLASASATTSTAVSTSGSNVTLTAATSGVAGTAIPISVGVSPETSTGTVTFYIGTTVIDVRSLSNGRASTTWTPAGSGTVTLKANYSRTGATVDGTASQTIVIGQPAQSDRITLTPSGSSTAWAPGAGFVLRNGRSVTLSARATSGLPVTLGIAGSCTLSGTTIQAKAGAGTCALNATTTGNGSFRPAVQSNTIALAAGIQTIQPKAPGFSRLAYKRWYRLADPGLVTNTGQPVSWVVTSGISRCRIQTTPLGAVVFIVRKHGSCTIAARAAGIPQSWLKLNQYFTYRA